MLRAATEVELREDDRIATREELLSGVRGKSGLLILLTDAVDGDVMDAAPALRVISNMAVGFDNVDVAEATRRGILVTHTPDVLTDTTADFAVALMLAVARRVAEGDRFVRNGRFEGWGPMLLLGFDLHDRTLGIVGFGRIGRAVAERVAGFRMRVLWYDPTIEAAPRGLGSERWTRVEKLDDLLSEADVVSLHVPRTPQTERMIAAPQLGRMKPSAILINTARGSAVHEEALVEALDGRGIAGAGLDVFEDEPRVHPGLLVLDNCIILPHMASASVATRTRMAVLAAENMLRALEGRRPQHLANPEVRASEVEIS